MWGGVVICQDELWVSFSLTCRGDSSMRILSALSPSAPADQRRKLQRPDLVIPCSLKGGQITTVRQTLLGKEQRFKGCVSSFFLLSKFQDAMQFSSRLWMLEMLIGSALRALWEVRREGVRQLKLPSSAYRSGGIKATALPIVV